MPKGIAQPIQTPVVDMFILDASAVSALGVLNASAPAGINLLTLELTDARHALNVDLLNDMGAGETWEHYATFLQTLSQEDVGSLLPPVGE